MAALTVVPNSGSASPSLPALPPEVSTPPAALTLYQIEETLGALVDTLDIVPADQEEELVARIGEAMIQAIDKRDNMGRFLAHVDAQIEFASAEIKRLQDRKQMFERVLERTESYVVRVVKSLGLNPKGRWQRLEGRTVTFGLRKSPASVAIDDDTVVPAAYRKATIKLSAPLWEQILDALDVDLAGEVMGQVKRSDEVSKTAIKAAIDGGAAVPGAHLVEDGVRLVRG
jgi:hypothetical protein